MLPLEGLKQALKDIGAHITALDIAMEDNAFTNEERTVLVRNLLSDGCEFSIRMLSMAAALVGSNGGEPPEEAEASKEGFLTTAFSDIRERTEEMLKIQRAKEKGVEAVRAEVAKLLSILRDRVEKSE